MNALLDTHALLWWITNDRRLGKRARDVIAAGDVFVSVVSLWEIEIKRGLARIEADTKAIIEEVSGTDGFALLDVQPSHVVSLVDLPPIHRDPFDRMLVAQARREHVPLLSRDRGLRAYEIGVVW